MSLTHPRREHLLGRLGWLPGLARHEHPAPSPAVFRPASSEPPLDDMLADPIVRAVMACDGVSEAEVRATVARAARNGTVHPHRKSR